MRKITAIAAFGAIAGATFAASSADTLNANLGLSATVTAGCTNVAQSSPFTFPSPLVQATQPVVPGVITTTCASTVPEVISFSSASVTSGIPYLSNNTATPNLIAYGLFTATSAGVAPTASGGVIHGGTSVTISALGVAAGGISTNGTGSAVLTTVYAGLASKVPADTPAGTYTDQVSVTLTF